MKKKFLKNIIIGLVVIAGLGVAGYFGYNYYLKLKKEVTPVFHAVPGNSNAIVEVSNPKDFWKELNQQEIYRQFHDFEMVERFASLVEQSDSLIKQNKHFSKWLDNNKMLLSLHYRGSDRFATLGLLQLPDIRQDENVVAFFSEHFTTELTKEEPYKIYKTIVNDTTEFYFSIPEGILLLSKDNNLIEQSLNFMQDDNHIFQVEDFKKVYNYRGKNVNANIYFNHNGFHRFLAQFAGKKYSDEFNKLSSYGSWTELDLIMEDKGLWFSGHTMINDSIQHYLKIFENQKADEIRIPQVLPARTALLSYYGIQDFEEFYKKYKKKLDHKKEKDEYLKNFKEKYGLDISTHFLSWIDKEFAKSVVKSAKGEYYEYAVMRTRDRQESRQSLNDLAEAINQENDKERDTIKHRSFKIGHIRDSYMFPLLFGDNFQTFTNPYYSIIGDYVVFSNSVEAIQYAINSYILDNTLEKNKQYEKFADKITGQANLYMYYNLRYADDYLLPKFSGKFKEFFKQNRQEIYDIPYGGFQYQYQENKIYTNIFIKSDTVDTDEQKQGWEVALDAPLAKSPEFVVDHYTKQKKIVAFDTRKHMYLIDLNGKIQWKIKLKEVPVGDVELIDYYDNGKYQYLFNSSNYVHCVDLNGEFVDGFPFKTKEKVTNSLAAFDYKGDKNYRILIAGDDKTIYNYRKNGERITGWQTPTVEHQVTNKVQRIVLGNKDFIIVTDTAGLVTFYNRRGEERITPNPGFTNNIQTPFYKVKKDGRELMMTTDKGGRLIYIDKEGNVDKTELNDFTENYTFLYEDFNKDGNKDFIFFDENYFYVYDRSYEVITTKKIDNDFTDDMTYFPVSKDSTSIIIRNKENKLQNITMDGIKKFEEPLFSEYPVLFYDNPASRKKNLVLSLGKRIESVPVN